MPYTSQSSEFWGWYLRHNTRTVWKHLSDAGIDVFASGPSNNPQAFLDLTNILPSMNGGFNRRWGLSLYFSQNGLSGSARNIVRTFLYNYPQDPENPSTTTNTNLWIGTDNQNFFAYTDAGVSFAGYGPTNFAHAGNVSAVTSRGFLYYGNGVDAPRKVNPSNTGSNTDSLNGIAIPGSSSTSYTTYPSAQPPTGLFAIRGTTGKGYLTAPNVTVHDISDGSGHSGAITVLIDSQGCIYSATVSDEGSSYTNAYAVVDPPPTGGTQAYLTLYTQQNPNGHRYGSIWGVDLAGPMSFVSGRQYRLALQNSKTGHTSDVTVSVASASNSSSVTDFPIGPISGATYKSLTAVYNQPNASASSVSVYPVFVSSIDGNGNAIPAGFTQMQLKLSVPAVGLDPQVDTVVLLATSDGGDIGTLYQVATIPLSSFTLASGYYTYTYFDNLPDSYNTATQVFNTSSTLLNADTWAETDASGDSFGILLNTPPTATGFLYPVVHQGRMFATDGKVLYYSKSLEEVTTSTGLITSKWEECWPGDYSLPVALNNEEIIGLKSDGTNLHIGTNKSIFTLYGSDPSNFAIPSQAFAQTGILSNDTWTVIYAEGQPSGFVWLTQDYKVMHSDFATYREIGTPIYPVLQNIDTSKLANLKVMSLTQGPYNFVILQLFLTGNSIRQPEFYIWESRLGKWYHWVTQNPELPLTNSVISSSFVYQFPAYTSASLTSGAKYLFMWRDVSTASTRSLKMDYFDPAAPSDYSGTPIPWSVQTSWQDGGDSTAIKVVNEVEFTSTDKPLTVSLYGATSQGQFGSGGTLLKTGTSVTGPLAALQVNKFYCAGAATAAKYFSLAFAPVSPGTSPSILTSFSMETYPMARI